MDQNIIVIDLDGTLTIEDSNVAYPDKSENPSIVNALLNAKEAGYGVTIATSRNMRTYQGDLNKITQFTLPIIKSWLQQKAIPYDEVIVGKPWCGPKGFYVDDKNLHLNEFIFRFTSVYSAHKLGLCSLAPLDLLSHQKSRLRCLFNLAEKNEEADYFLLISPGLAVDLYTVFTPILHKLNQLSELQNFKINFYRMLADETCERVKNDYIYLLKHEVARSIVAGETTLATCKVDLTLPHIYVEDKTS